MVDDTVGILSAFQLIQKCAVRTEDRSVLLAFAARICMLCCLPIPIDDAPRARRLFGRPKSRSWVSQHLCLVKRFDNPLLSKYAVSLSWDTFLRATSTAIHLVVSLGRGMADAQLTLYPVFTAATVKR